MRQRIARPLIHKILPFGNLYPKEGNARANRHKKPSLPFLLLVVTFEQLIFQRNSTVAAIQSKPADVTIVVIGALPDNFLKRLRQISVIINNFFNIYYSLFS